MARIIAALLVAVLPYRFPPNANTTQAKNWTDDAADNLLNDGTSSSTYDALNRVVTVTSGGQLRRSRYIGETKTWLPELCIAA